MDQYYSRALSRLFLTPVRASARILVGLRAGLLIGLLLTACVAWAATNVYDANGRLVGVTNASGESARYAYDAMGNLTGIERFAASDLVIFTFAPTRGAPGSSVVVTGRGFNTTASANSVKFNGVEAAITAAAADRLVVVVPASATTGPIAVTTGSVTATSVTDFTVEISAKAPTISGVSPLIANAGTSLTIVGQNLSPVAGQSTASVNGKPGLPSGTSNTQILMPVPAGASSGKVTVTTAFGTAVSADDVLVPPPEIGAGNIGQSTRLTVDSPAQNFTASVAERYTAVMFNGAGGDWLSAQFQNISVQTIAYILYDTGNRKIGSGTVSAASPTIHLPRLVPAGTYLLLLKPSAVPATWKLAIERSKRLQAGSAPIALDTAVSGQSKRLIFDAVAGAELGLGLSDHEVPATWTSASATVYAPDGTQVAQQVCEQAQSGCGLNLSARYSGTYSVIVQPAQVGLRTLAFDATLSADIADALEVNVAETVSLTRRGQNARLAFSGNAGEVLALLVAGQTTNPAGRSAYYRVYKPDGTLWKSLETSAGATLSMSLPVAGNYTVLVDPAYGETATTQLLLSTGSPQGMQLDGAQGEFATSLPGEGIYFVFTATAGQQLGLGISDLTLSGGTAVQLSVYRPDGSVLSASLCESAKGGCDVNLPNTTAGKYAVEVTPTGGGQTMAFKTTLSTDATGSLPRDMPTAFAVARRGQNLRLNFTGVVGDTVVLNISGQTTVPANGRAYYRVYKPDGNSFASTIASGDKTLHMVLPVGGSYQLFIDPEFGATTAASLEFEAGQLGQMELDGSTGAFETTTPGQDIAIAVNATAGQNLSLGLSDLVLNTGTQVFVKAFAPNGSTYQFSTSCPVSTTGCDIDFFKPVTGIYSVIISPASSSQTIKFRATLSSDATGALQRDLPISLSLDRRGQNGWLSFTGTAGETVAIQAAGQETAPAGQQTRYLVFRPSDGTSAWESMTTVVTGGALNLSLPVTGTYMLYVDPDYGAAASMQITLATGTTSGMVLNGASANIETTLPGQTAFFKVSATAGQNLSVAISDLVVSSDDQVYVAAYAPNGGTYLFRTLCAVSDGGCDVDIFKPVTGTYTVVVSPINSTQAMQFKATLSSDVTGSLTRDTTQTLTLGRRGQNGWLSFTGTAGETVAIQAAGQETAPAGQQTRYLVFRPSDGTSAWESMTTVVTGGALNLSLPVTGTYMLYVDPDYGAAASMQITLATGTTSGMVLNGASANIETTLPGQTAFFKVSATAGQNLSVAISDLVVSSDDQVYVAAYAPNGGTYLFRTLCAVSDGGCDVDIFKPVTGTYTVVVSPINSTQAMQFKATLSSDVTGSLTRDTTQTLTLGRRGQNGWLSFTGTAGETVAIQAAGQETAPAGQQTRYLVFRPSDGTSAWESMTTVVTGGALNLSLPVTGTYMLYVDPDYGATANMQITLATGTTSGMVLNGASANIETTLPGQTAFFKVSATAGQNLSVAISDLVVSSDDQVYVVAYAPNGGTYLFRTLCAVSDGGCDVDIFKPVTGTYTVVVSPINSTQAMQFKATLSSDVTGSLTRDTPQTLTLSRRGQNGWLSFSGTTGETLALQISDLSTNPAGEEIRYSVYRPSDTTSAWKSLENTTGGVISLPLPVTGTYQIYVDPLYGVTAGSKLTLDTTP